MEDCIFGVHTERAVVSLQKLRFSDKTEHDGIIGTNTWTHLDAVGGGAPPPAPEPLRTCDPCVLEEPPFTAQPPESCWAAGTTMIVSAHDKATYSIEEVLNRADLVGTAMYGSSRWTRDYLKRNKPIPDKEFATFLKELGINSIPGASYTPAGICDLLKVHGPVGFSLFVGGNVWHMIVVYGIADSDGICSVIYHDPNPIVGGASSMPFDTFNSMYSTRLAHRPINVIAFP